MKDEYGNEFTEETVHCWNCEHYQDMGDSYFSWCKKNKACVSMYQLKKMNPVTCGKFSSKHIAKARGLV